MQFIEPWAVIAAMAIYGVIIGSIGVYAYKVSERRSLEDFFLMGRLLGPVVGAFTMVYTLLSGFTFFGMAGLAYITGLGEPVMFSALVIMFTILLFVFGPKLWYLSKLYRYITPGDYLDDRLQSKFTRVLATIIFLIYMVFALAAQMEAVGAAFTAMTGGALPYWSGCVALAILLIILAAIGGFRGVVWTDFIQGVFILGMLWVALFWLLVSMGGPAKAFGAIAATEPIYLQLPGPFNFYSPTAWFSLTCMYTIYMWVHPSMMQRIFALRNPRSLRLFAALICVVTIATVLPVGLIGVLGRLHFRFAPFSPQCDEVFPLLVLKLLPPWFALLIICGAMAAIVTTADSFILTTSSLLIKDCWLAFRPQISEAKAVLASRLLIVLLTIIAYLISLPRGLIIAAMKGLADTFLTAGLVAPIGLALYLKRINKVGAIAGMLAGVIVNTALTIGPAEFNVFAQLPPLQTYPVVYGLIASAVVTLILSYLTKPVPRETLKRHLLE